MICKDDDVCPSCIMRRKKKDCGYEPFGYGPDQDGEYGVGCEGQISTVTISDANLNDVLTDYYGIGDPLPLDLLFPILIWAGFNWLNDPSAWGEDQCDGDCSSTSSKDQSESELRHLSRQVASNNIIEFTEDRCTCGGKLEHKHEWLIPWLHEKHIELQCDRCPFHYIHVRPLPGNIFLKPCYTCDKSLKGDFRNKGETCDNWRFCKDYRRWKDDNEYHVPP